MNTYTLGFRHQLYPELLTSDTLDKVLAGDVIICSADRCGAALPQIYRLIKKAMLKGVRPVLVGTERTSSAYKVLTMLMVAYEHYDVYPLYPGQELSKAYVDTIIGRTPSVKDVAAFIDPKMAAYDSVGIILLDLRKAVASGDIEGIKALVSNNRAAIDSAVELMDELKHFVDKLSSQDKADTAEASNLRAELEAAKREVEELRAKAANTPATAVAVSDDEKQRIAEEAIKAVKEDYEKRLSIVRGELKAARGEVTTLEEKINGMSASIRSYTEIKTPLITCRAKSIMYFKEVSSVRYANTLITKMVEIMSKLRRLRVKLVIYDNPHGFVTTYKPLSVVTYAEFRSRKQAVVEQLESIVVIEPHPEIIESILGEDYDVVVIVDRLKQATDLVSGNNVHKYWIINSVQESYALKSQYSVDPRAIISSRGEFTTGFSPEEIRDFRDKTASAKLQDYMHMRNFDGSFLIEGILEKAKVTALKGRTARG